jgi:L-asparaginase
VTAQPPNVAVIATGGTIDSLGISRVDLAWYTETRERLPDGEVLLGLPELADVASVEQVPVKFLRRPSYALSPREWISLAGTVAEVLTRDDIAGVVVTHGTNTLEETAYFLHLAVPSRKPVVLVGAMRPANGLGTDGQLNLLRAVQVAASPQARGHGVLVVLNDTIHSAREATKTTTFRVEAFRSPGSGPLGFVEADGRVIFQHRALRLERQSRFPLQGLVGLPRVDVLTSYVGADGALVDAAVAAGAAGLVSAGTGAGHATPLEDEAYDRAIALGVVVCQATRVGAGRVSRSPAMAARGIVTADDLQPWKARVLLSLALTKTRDPEEIQTLFDPM